MGTSFQKTTWDLRRYSDFDDSFEIRRAPDYEGDVRFIDIESGAGVEVTMTKRAVQDYLEKNETRSKTEGVAANSVFSCSVLKWRKASWKI